MFVWLIILYILYCTVLYYLSLIYIRTNRAVNKWDGAPWKDLIIVINRRRWIVVKQHHVTKWPVYHACMHEYNKQTNACMVAAAYVLQYAPVVVVGFTGATGAAVAFVNFGMGKAQTPRLNCCFPRRVALTNCSSISYVCTPDDPVMLGSYVVVTLYVLKKTWPIALKCSTSFPI